MNEGKQGATSEFGEVPQIILIVEDEPLVCVDAVDLPWESGELF